MIGGDVYMDETNDEEADADDVIILHMDIREPLKKLQKLIEQKIGMSLKNYTFWLQDAQELEPHKNLVDQCVKGEGLVQINVQIQTITMRINIVDVLKPTEAALAALGLRGSNELENFCIDQETVFETNNSKINPEDENSLHSNFRTDQKPCLNWVLDDNFKKDQIRLNIPDDPLEWSKPQVKYWFDWAVQKFNLSNVNSDDWKLSGGDLCSLTHEEFRAKVPDDPGNTFWTHIQLLKECKFVSVIHNAIEHKSEYSCSLEEEYMSQREPKIMRLKVINSASNTPENSPVHNLSTNNYSIGSGNNGQVQLWQFLLELLTDRGHTSIIQWVGTEGEFKLVDPECVARLWGEKKNKPAMNYEKLSRALRYYYDGDMISKVSGKRFAYKFDCDLKLLIGYDAKELAALVNTDDNKNSSNSKKLEITDSREDELSPLSEED